MKLDVGICGLSHYKSFVRFLSQKGILNNFFYSHKVTLTPERLGIQDKQGHNLIGRQYLVHLHGRIFGARLFRLKVLYSLIWQLQFLSLNYEVGELFEFAMHGNFLYVLKRIRKRYDKIIGHPLTAHPICFSNIINKEFAKRNKRVLFPHIGHLRMAKEQNYCDAIHVASNWVKNSYIANGFPEDKIKVIPYGANLDKFKIASRQIKRKFTVLCVGNISLIKGQLYLLEAWKKLNLPDAELIIVGAMTSSVKGLIEPYREFFTHYSFIPHHELKEIYNQADLFILPSLNDGFGLVVLEAMACGLPVIVTENTGASDAIEDGDNGFIIPACSPEALMEKIEFFFRNRKLARRMGEASSDICQKQFTWEVYVEELEKFYSKL